MTACAPNGNIKGNQAGGMPPKAEATDHPALREVSDLTHTCNGLVSQTR